MTLLGTAGFAQGIEALLGNIVPPETVRELVSRGIVQHTVYRSPGEGLSLEPKNSLAAAAASFWDADPAVFFSESLYLYEKAEGKETSPGGDIGRISVILRSLSRLEGIEYFSTSRNKMRTLYASSYTVSGPGSRDRIPDQTAGSAEGKSLWALQKDLTFGEYHYRYDYRQTGDSVAFYSRNGEGLRYSLLKLVDADRLRVSLVVQDLGTHLLIYSLTRADFPALPGIEGKLNSSFTTRAEALYRWFIREYERT